MGAKKFGWVEEVCERWKSRQSIVREFQNGAEGSKLLRSLFLFRMVCWMRDKPQMAISFVIFWDTSCRTWNDTRAEIAWEDRKVANCTLHTPILHLVCFLWWWCRSLYLVPGGLSFIGPIAELGKGFQWLMSNCSCNTGVRRTYDDLTCYNV